MTCEVWAVSTVLNQIFSKKSASIFFLWRLVSTHAPLLAIVLSVLRFKSSDSTFVKGRHGRDRMVVGFTTTCAISAYHH